MNRMGPENDIQLRSPGKKATALLLGHATPYSHDQVGILFFQGSQPTQKAIQFLLCLGPDRAGIDHNQPCILSCFCGDVTIGLQQTFNPLGIVDVHLTTNGLYFI